MYLLLYYNYLNIINKQREGVVSIFTTTGKVIGKSSDDVAEVAAKKTADNKKLLDELPFANKTDEVFQAANPAYSRSRNAIEANPASATLDAPVSSFDSAQAWASAHKRGLAVGAGVVTLGGITAYGLTNRGDSDTPAGSGGTIQAGTQSTKYAEATEQATGAGSFFGTINQTAGYGGIPSGSVGGSVGGSSLVSSAYTNELKETQALMAAKNIDKGLQEAQNFQQHFVSYPQPTTTSSTASEPVVSSGKIVYS